MSHKENLIILKSTSVEHRAQAVLSSGVSNSDQDGRVARQERVLGRCLC